MTSPILYPAVNDYLGEPVSPRSEDYIEGREAGVGRDYATTALPPLGWNHGRPDGSRMVGWTLHYHGKTAIVEQHAFNINPQGITRTGSPRNQMFATQGGFYVDDFGAGAETIQLTQLVASGRATAQGGGSIYTGTMRQDVVRFYDLIWTKATANPGQYDVYFHDSHFWDQVNGRTPELVYFPSNGWQLVRHVQQNNVWLINLTMISLNAPPNATKAAQQIPGQPNIKVYVVRRGDTLTKIAARLAGKSGTHQRILQLRQQIIALTKQYGQDDISKNRQVALYSPSNPSVATSAVNVTRNHITPGEKIILPAG
jgi:hypothetical protein